MYYSLQCCFSILCILLYLYLCTIEHSNRVSQIWVRKNGKRKKYSSLWVTGWQQSHPQWSQCRRYTRSPSRIKNIGVSIRRVAAMHRVQRTIAAGGELQTRFEAHDISCIGRNWHKRFLSRHPTLKPVNNE